MGTLWVLLLSEPHGREIDPILVTLGNNIMSSQLFFNSY